MVNPLNMSNPRSRVPDTLSFSVEDRQKERQASIDVLSGIVGALICTTFVLSQRHAPALGTPQVPKEQIAGMLFTCLLCPLTYFGFKSFYFRNRVFLVLLVRMVFAIGTIYDYEDTPNEALTWPAFLARFIYSSRALVMSWGCFGWQLPFGLHVAVQAAHAAAASRLIAPVCAAPALAKSTTFMSLNIAKIRTVMTVLDWPFAVVWPPAPGDLNAGTSNIAACSALIFWAQITLGWLIPTSLLASSLSGGNRWRRAAQDQGVLITGALAQALWCFIRVAALKFIQ